MTFRDKMKSMLVERGLFESQADAVIEFAAKDNQAFTETLPLSTAGCPSSVGAAMWVTTKTAAIHWIDTSMPKHWARPMFTGES